MSRRICTLSISFVFAACGGRDDSTPSPGAGVAGVPPTTRLISPLPDHDWKLPSGDLANTRFSPLTQIDTSNVGKLHQVATFSTGIMHGHEGSPLVIGSTMYVVTPYPDELIALDLANHAAVKWVYRPHPDPRAIGIACCDVVNRGASYADG